MSARTEQAALEVLVFLADIEARVDSFCTKLRQKAANLSARSKTTSEIECRRYESGLTLSIYVETESDEEQTLTWWMDIMPREDGWFLDAHLAWNGEDTIKQFPERVVADFQAVKEEAPKLLQELFDAGEAVLRGRASP